MDENQRKFGANSRILVADELILEARRLNDTLAHRIMDTPEVFSGDGDIAPQDEPLLRMIGASWPCPNLTEVVGVLLKAMRHKDPDVRATAAYLFGPSATAGGRWYICNAGRSDPVLLTMLEALADKHPKVREYALNALQQFAPRNPVAVMPTVIDGPLKDHDIDTVKRALQVLNACGIDFASTIVPAIVGLLDHNDSDVFVQVCQMLSGFETDAEQAVPALIVVVERNSDPNRVVEAIQALKSIDRGTERVVSALIGVVERSSDPNCVAESIRALMSLDRGAVLISQTVVAADSRERLLMVLRTMGSETRSLRRQLQQEWDERTITSPRNKRAAHSRDFRSVIWFGSTYKFTAIQAACAKVLWEEWERGTDEIGGDAVLVDAE